MVPINTILFDSVFSGNFQQRVTASFILMMLLLMSNNIFLKKSSPYSPAGIASTLNKIKPFERKTETTKPSERSI